MASLNSADPTSRMGGETRSAAGDVLARFCLPVGLFATALALRLSPWHSVFQPDGVLPAGMDAYYHLRRIQYAIDHFPDFLSFDPFINFPHGAQPIWPPTFDWLVAVLLRVLVGPDDSAAMERCAMWVAPVLGAATVVGVYFLGRRFFSQGVAVLAALLLSVLPAHFGYSQIGYLDHHVAVALLSTAMLWAGMRLVGQNPAVDPFDRDGMVSAALLGLAMGVALLIWPGSLIHVAIAQVALVVRSLTAATRFEAAAWARRFAFVHLLTFLIVLPMSAGNEWLLWGSFSPVVLSNFQPVYLATAACAFWLCSQFWTRWSLCEGRLPRAGVAAVLGAVLTGLLFALIPELREGGSDAWAWFARKEEFQAVVAESEPLFYLRGVLNWSRPMVPLSAFVYLTPLALASFAWTHRGTGRADCGFFLWWCGALFVATLSQRRFMNSYAIPHALLMAYSMLEALRAVAQRSASRAQSSVGWRLGLIATALVLAVLSPSYRSYEPAVRNVARAIRGEAPQPYRVSQKTRLLADTARWLGENSPPLRGGGYSVLAPWGDGHLIKYVAQRPIVQDNFGDDVAKENFQLAEDYFSAMSEQRGLKHLLEARVRYVEVRATGSGHGAGYRPGSLFARLFRLNGSRGQVGVARDGKPILVGALQSHRLIYESKPLVGGDPEATAFSRLFEIVRGARVVGHAPAGSIVGVQLELQGRNGRRLYYEAVVPADSEGRYALRLPYSNEPFSSAVQAADSYRVIVGERVEPLIISEVAVRQGLEIRGPRF